MMDARRKYAGRASQLLRIIIGALPGFLILGATMFISWITGHPGDLFLSYSTIGILIRFVLVSLVLLTPMAFLPRLVAVAGNWKDDGVFGKLVKSDAIPHQEFSWYVDLLIRPMQGIGLCLVFAERFLNFLGLSTGTSYANIAFRSTVFALTLANPLISFFLSLMWTFDDLGVKLYNRKAGEVRLLGSSVGVVLPLITGAIGVISLFHRAMMLDALSDLAESMMVLYPPYLLFVVVHHEFLTRRGISLSENLLFDKIEMKVKQKKSGSDNR